MSGVLQAFFLNMHFKMQMSLQDILCKKKKISWMMLMEMTISIKIQIYY